MAVVRSVLRAPTSLVLIGGHVVLPGRGLMALARALVTGRGALHGLGRPADRPLRALALGLGALWRGAGPELRGALARHPRALVRGRGALCRRLPRLVGLPIHALVPVVHGSHPARARALTQLG